MRRAGHPWPTEVVYAVVTILAAVAGAVVITSLVEPRRWPILQYTALGLLLVLGGIVAIVAVRTLWRFVLVLIATRVSLDVLNDQFGLLDPAALVGIVFIAWAVVWLIGRLMAGKLVPPSVAVKLLYCLVAWAFVGAALAWFQTEALIAVTKLLAGVLMLAVLEQLLPGHPERVKQLLVTVLASAVVPVGVALFQGATGTGNLDTPGFNRVYGTSVHPVSLATYLIIVLIVAVGLVGQQKHRGALLVLIGASAVALFWTYTRSAWLIAAVGLLLVLFRVRRVLVVPAITALTAIPFLRPDIAARFADLSNRQSALTDDAANSLVWRFGYWEDVLTVSADYRLTGVGLDTVSMWTSLGLQPHNIFVQAYVELGVIGLLLFTAAIGAMGLQFRRRRRLAATNLERLTANIAGIVALCIFIQALTTNPLAGTVTWWYLAAACTFGFVDTAAHTPGRPASPGPGGALEQARLTRTLRTRMAPGLGVRERRTG